MEETPKPKGYYNPNSLEALAEKRAGVPAGFFRWYDNTTKKTHTEIPLEQLPQLIKTYVSSGAHKIWGATQPTAKSLGSSIRIQK